MLKIKNLSFKNILNGVSFSLQKSEKALLLGESGGGKSTFLKALNRLIPCEYDEFLFFDQAIQSYPILNLRQEILLLFQEPLLFKTNIKEELLWPFTLKNCTLEKPPTRKLNDILELCLLKKSLKDDSSFLSGGEKQRLCLARTLLLEPKLLLLDEPTSALNEELSKKILQNLLSYKKNTAMIIISHNEKLKEEYDFSVYKMQKGSLKKEVKNERGCR